MDPTKLASLVVGGTLGLGAVALFRAPLWAGLLLGVGGALVTLGGVAAASQAPATQAPASPAAS